MRDPGLFWPVSATRSHNRLPEGLLTTEATGGELAGACDPAGGQARVGGHTPGWSHPLAAVPALLERWLYAGVTDCSGSGATTGGGGAGGVIPGGSFMPGGRFVPGFESPELPPN